MVAARSFGMSVNRLIDARARRPQPAHGRAGDTGGQADPPTGVDLRVVWLAILVYATFNLPVITRYLWPLVVIPMVVYPYTKRWTPFCHLVLGLADGLGPVGAWVAVTGKVTWEPFVLGAGVGLWIAGFDIIYAFMDIKVDREQGLRSIPADFGETAGLWTTRGFHLLAVLLLVLTGWRPGYELRLLPGGGGLRRAPLLRELADAQSRSGEGRCGLHDHERHHQRGVPVLHHPQPLRTVSRRGYPRPGHAAYSTASGPALRRLAGAGPGAPHVRRHRRLVRPTERSDDRRAASSLARSGGDGRSSGPWLLRLWMSAAAPATSPSPCAGRSDRKGRVVGVDMSEEMLDVARDKCGRNQLYVEFETGGCARPAVPGRGGGG